MLLIWPSTIRFVTLLMCSVNYDGLFVFSPLKWVWMVLWSMLQVQLVDYLPKPEFSIVYGSTELYGFELDASFCIGSLIPLDDAAL